MDAALGYVIPLVIAIFGLVVILLGARLICRSGRSDSPSADKGADSDDRA
ncbi:MAG: hypothetical protein NDJ18_02255 [candidate division Zixibacteria bacterium]|nr:hypothetical protein [candidate division Zixibacteria bacterium]